MSVYDGRTVAGLRHDVQLMGDLLRVNCPLYVDKWVESWMQAYAVRVWVVALSGECLRVKADMVLLAGNTVWSISEHIRAVCEDTLYKLTLPLRYLYTRLRLKVLFGSHWKLCFGDNISVPSALYSFFCNSVLYKLTYNYLFIIICDKLQ